MHGIIYGLYDPESDELRYVGQTINPPSQRLAAHLAPSSLRNSHTYLANWLRCVLQRGLKPEMRVLDFAKDQHELDALEIAYIAWGRVVGVRLVNTASGGGGLFGFSPSAETKEKIAAKQRGVPRAKHTIEWKIAQSQRMKNRPPNPELLMKMRQSRIGSHHTSETKAKISLSKKGQKPWISGRKHTESTRIKIREAIEGKPRRRRVGPSDEVILEHLAANYTKKEIAEKFQMSRGTVIARIKKLREQGHDVRTSFAALSRVRSSSCKDT